MPIRTVLSPKTRRSRRRWPGRPRSAVARAGAVLAIALALAAALNGCGGSSQATVTRMVHLAVSAPASGTRIAAGTIAVSGKVSPPRATVLVAGHRTSLAAGGSFATTVNLTIGTNLIDVIAGAPHARPAMLALRVVRYELASVPSVVGLTPAAARKALTAAGLKAKVSNTDDFFTEVLPGRISVCSQSPTPESKVSPGATITLRASKFCF